MSGDRIFADTSFLVNFFNGQDIVRSLMEDKVIFISVITEMELLSHPGLSESNEKIIRDFLDQVVAIEIESDIRELAIKIRRKNKTKLPDAVIAATAIKYDLPLFTMDKDFGKIMELNSVIIKS